MTDHDRKRLEMLEKFKRQEMIKLQGNGASNEEAEGELPELFRRAGFTKNDLDQLLAASSDR